MKGGGGKMTATEKNEQNWLECNALRKKQLDMQWMWCA
jgi:hypothetical protein